MFLALGEFHPRRAAEVNGRVEVFRWQAGMMTGHLTWALLDLKRSMSSWQAFSKEEALRDSGSWTSRSHPWSQQLSIMKSLQSIDL